jgi:type VI secretion system secreted protein Hcp
MGGGGGSGKGNFGDLSVTKYIDKASADLLQACATGKHLAEGTFVARKAGDKPLEYVKLKMEDIIVTSVSMGGSGGEDRQTENVTLNFAKFEYNYVEQTAQGSAGAKPRFGWDIAANVPK